MSRGFTLIEVLVALVIVAVGMAAVIEAMGSAADTAGYVRDKTFAEWIALNRIAQVRLAAQLPSIGSTTGDLDYAGRHWNWQQDVVDPMTFPGLLQVNVKVQQADTPQGKDSPWLVTVSGIVGNAVSPPMLQSVFQEYPPDLPPGAAQPGTLGQPATTTPTQTPAPSLGGGRP